jgi:hypothetical protein
VTLSTTAGSGAVASYTIAVSSTGVTLSAGTNSAGSNKAANELVGDTWRNTGLSPVDVVYTITPVGTSGCSGDPFTVTVTVNPEPVATAINGTVCSDQALGSAFTLRTNSTSVSAATYTIAVSSTLTLSSGTASAGSGKAANELTDDVWTNTGSVAVNVVYTVTPVTSDGCSGDPFTVTATINPEPVVSSSVPATLSVCSDQALGINLSTSAGNVGAASYTITIANTGGLIQSAGVPSGVTGRAANDLAADAWTNPGSSDVVVTYTITPVSASGCSGNPYTIAVTVKPEPVGVANTATVCSDVARVRE